jgi:hypothetical protein
MKNTVKALVLSAAVAGLVGGTTLRAATVNTTNDATTKISAAKTGIATNFDDKTKHSCKGKNDCKGQGGCKAGDNGCKAKNSCKGKGGCATDGSKPGFAA